MKLVLRHIFLFSTATILLVGICILAVGYSRNLPEGSVTVPGNYFSNITETEANSTVFSTKLEKSVLLLGSSELTSNSSFKPQLFLPSKGVGVIAYGHAGFQSFAIQSILASMLPSVADPEKLKIVIILSPVWFETEGTHIERFLESASPYMLDRIYFGQGTDQQFKFKLARYIIDHKSEIKRLSSAHNLFMYYYWSQTSRGSTSISRPDKAILKLRLVGLELLAKLDIVLYEAFNRISMFLTHGGTTVVPAIKHVESVDIASIDWNALEKSAEESQKSDSQGNPIRVNNEYFLKYLNPQQPFTLSPTEPISRGNPEFRDLSDLCQFMSRNNIKPLFIMQPINTLYYRNAPNYEDVLKSVGDLMQEYGFEYLDLWDWDKSTPWGVLKDIMHFGDVGWLTVDRRILDWIGESH